MAEFVMPKLGADMSTGTPVGTYGGDFNWFLDRSAQDLPTPAVLSVPMWVYRLLMFAWAAWIAVELRRWLPLAWRAWTAGGFWRGKPGSVYLDRDDLARRVAAFKDVRLVEIAGAGHMVHFDRPDELAAAIRDFV